MCGLVGIAGDTTNSWKDIFTELLIIDCVRGMHSTGAGFVSRGAKGHKEEFKLAKKPGHPFNVIWSDEYKDGMATNNPQKVMLGHNRFATIGEKNEKNAHPFAFNNVMGMHNGTLDKYCIKYLDQVSEDGTDSEAIFNTINKVGVKETMTLVTGAWALVWFDNRDHTINFLRNDKRPLHYCYSEDRCTLLWASEATMLRYVMARAGKKILEDKVFIAIPDTHYSWEVPKSISTKFAQPLQEKVEGKKWEYFPQTSYSSYTYKAPKKDDNSNIVTFPERSETSKFRPPYKDLYGKVINKKQFHEMVSEGCAFCGSANQHWGEFIHPMGGFSGKNTPYLCEGCFNSDETFPFVNYAL